MRSTSFRLPESTAQQLEALMHHLDMTRTQVLIVALDRLHREMFGSKGREKGTPGKRKL